MHFLNQSSTLQCFIIVDNQLVTLKVQHFNPSAHGEQAKACRIALAAGWKPAPREFVHCYNFSNLILNTYLTLKFVCSPCFATLLRCFFICPTMFFVFNPTFLVFLPMFFQDK